MSVTFDTMTMSEELRVQAIESPSSAVLEDRRAIPRARRRFKVTLTGLGDVEGVECQAVDISEGGMCVKAPVAGGFDVGQRIDLTVPSAPDPQTGRSVYVTSCYATIVRSAVAPHDDALHVLLGLRFDHPFYF
jgi:hypothetical protein